SGAPEALKERIRTLMVPSALSFCQATTNRPWPSMDTWGLYESAVEESTGIGKPVAWPVLSNRCAQMSWWPGPEEGPLTQTATEVPLDELALSEKELSVVWELRLTWSPKLRRPRRLKISSWPVEALNTV